MNAIKRCISISAGICLTILCPVDPSWSLSAQKITLMEREQRNKSLSSWIKEMNHFTSYRQVLGTLEKKVSVLSESKGHSEEAYQMLFSAHGALEQVKSMLQKAQEIENRKEETIKKADALDQESASLEKQVNSTLLKVDLILQRVERMQVGEPIVFPERCALMTDPGEVQKMGLLPVKGIVESFNRVWVLTTLDEKAVDGVKRYHLSDQVGLMGAKDHNSGLVVKSHTPNHMVVIGLLHPETKQIVCVSTAQKVMTP